MPATQEENEAFFHEIHSLRHIQSKRISIMSGDLEGIPHAAIVLREGGIRGDSMVAQYLTLADLEAVIGLLVEARDDMRRSVT